MEIDAPLGDASNKTKKKGGKKGKTIEETYQKKTQLEHILLRPDTYIGSIEMSTQPMWVLNPETKRIVRKSVTYVPGLFKIFDEIMVNAADNKQRDPSMTTIKVVIDAEKGEISVANDGKGIPVEMHAEHGCYVPELIFGHLLTGSNFDDDEKKTTGGRNGYGAKLANIFSTAFTVETADSVSGKKLSQTWVDNMARTAGAAAIAAHKGKKDFTKVTFAPDLARFKMASLDADIVGLLSRRAYDVAASASCHGSPLKVELNGERVPVKSFAQYVALHDGLEPPAALERIDERWTVGVAPSDGTFTHLSFVNSINTSKGGSHVNAVADQVAAKLAAAVKKKNKGQEVKPAFIKAHLCVYVDALIVNPAFDSQTKETLTTKERQFGSKCVLPDKFLKAIEKSGVVDRVLAWTKFKQDEQLKRKGGSKKARLTGITKLDDANHAGGAKGKDCTLILTEGDSAKALAVSGLGVVGRDLYGVFPLKGKPLNVREASHAAIMKNEEIQNVVKILGLRFGTSYDASNVKTLRYGHLMIMTDQDHDGSHIKGLLINAFHHFWPSLLAIPGFLRCFITPIVKATPTAGKKDALTFFTLPEYAAWKAGRGDSTKGFSIKYYKGLGTSTGKEAKEYFSTLDTHQLDYAPLDVGAREGDLIDMAFSKKRVEDRKDWLRALEPGTFVDYAVDAMSYRDFVNKELVLFSVADNQRSIPSVVDGRKPSQRKVLVACFKRKLRKEIKVAQLAGYISEHAAYHHGEMSLTGTIVGMAQDFVGSNNVNLLTPAGQFGTRIMGGKDAASSRYIFTKLEAVARKVFHPDDDAVLDYLEDDGQSIEPAYYVPVVPFALCNGADGIGTGWATTVPNYAPRALIGVMRRMITAVGGDVDGALSELTAIECGADDLAPAYRGFAGAIAPKAAAGTFAVSGNCTRTGDATVLVDELPVRKWTHDYKLWLEAQLTGDDKTSARPRGCFSLFLWTAPLLSRAGPRGSRTSRRTTRIRRCRSRSRSPTARSSTRPRRRSAA
jgi:DNA topoisomerase-2